MGTFVELQLPKPSGFQSRSTPDQLFDTYHVIPLNSRTSSGPRLSSTDLAEDIGVTTVEDNHGGAAEEFTAGSSEFNLMWS